MIEIDEETVEWSKAIYAYNASELINLNNAPFRMHRFSFFQTKIENDEPHRTTSEKEEVY